jgi:hypothetical protein
MAARAHIPFLTAFQAAVRPTGNLAALAGNNDLRASMLALFNRSYKIGYEMPWQSDGAWEDARTWAEITPVNGTISYDVFGDARSFEIYSLDPRVTRLAQRVQVFTDKTGILLNDELTTVWVSWLPRRFHFDTTNWLTATAYVVGDVRTLATSGECYRCIVAHTSGTFATDLAASNWVLMPVLEVLEEFLIQHLHGTYLREHAGQIQSGAPMQREAMADLMESYRAEVRRHLKPENPNQ